MLKKIVIIGLSIIAIISLCLVSAIVIKPNQISSRNETMYSDAIDSDLYIAYFSNLYYGEYVDNEYLDSAIKIINDYKPDIVLFGGDLIGKTLDQVSKNYLIDSLKSIKSKYGKFYCLGDNDTNSIYDIMDQANFKLISNNYNRIRLDDKNIINIVGINSNSPYLESLNSMDTNNLTLVISHYPNISNNISNYDLMLSSMDETKQIYFPIFSNISKPFGYENYIKGKHINNNSLLDISTGLGRHNSNARFFTFNEIVFYRITKTDITK